MPEPKELEENVEEPESEQDPKGKVEEREGEEKDLDLVPEYQLMMEKLSSTLSTE